MLYLNNYCKTPITTENRCSYVGDLESKQKLDQPPPISGPLNHYLNVAHCRGFKYHLHCV